MSDRNTRKKRQTLPGAESKKDRRSLPSAGAREGGRVFPGVKVQRTGDVMQRAGAGSIGKAPLGTRAQKGGDIVRSTSIPAAGRTIQGTDAQKGECVAPGVKTKKAEDVMQKTSIQKGAQVTLDVTDLNGLGCGVARLPDGRVVFVAGAVAGDRVSAELIKVNKTYTVARLLEILSPSPDREDGFCAAPAGCGGCVYRNLSYARELELKRTELVHTFRKAGLPDAVIEPVRTTGEVCGYRNKAAYPIARGKNGLYGGFYAQKTHHVMGYFACSLQPAAFGEILAATCTFFTARGVDAYDEATGKGLLRHLYLREGRGSGEILVCPVINGGALPDEAEYVHMLREKFPRVSGIVLNRNEENTNLILGRDYRTLWGKPYLRDVFCGMEIHIAPEAFYQVNHNAAELLYGIAAEKAGLTGRELLLDLYCGVGTVGLSMAHRVREVIGVEMVPGAVECARENAARNGIRNAAFYCGDAANTERLLAVAEVERGRLFPDVVVLDPPRRGCDEALLRFLAARQVPRIVYISCGPDSLARDAARLCALGYEMSAVTPVDLFPRTGHVETVVLLSRKKAKDYLEVNVEMDDDFLTKAESKGTYDQIKQYILEKYQVKVSSLYIAQVKELCGIKERENYNHSKKADSKQPQVPEDKRKIIIEALQYFKMI